MQRKMTFDEWAEQLQLARGKPDYACWLGKSPGGVAADLGVSRQRVWALIKEGRLDLLMLADSRKAEPSAWLVTDASQDRYRKSRPGVQQQLLLATRKRRRVSS